MYRCYALVLLLCMCMYVRTTVAKRPHILFVLADDIGWNDVGYHGSEIKTTNIDKLAKKGVTFENYYVQPICTPSRSQLLTGRYQIRFGLQHMVISGPQRMGLPLNETILPELLRDVGYKTHMVGKWHLGFYKQDFMPTMRGFDSFYGYLNSEEDYYSKNYQVIGFSGYDFYNDLEIDLSGNGTYSVDLYTKRVDEIVHKHNQSEPLFMYLPFQSAHAPDMAPNHYLNMYPFIEDKKRKLHAAMVTALDDGVGKVVESFKSAGIWQDTLMIFSTDNGGIHANGGNNWPLRGEKLTLYEGGLRGVSFALGAGLNNPGTINNEFFHISDWFPTLLHIAGANKPKARLDGMNVWRTVSNNAPSPRTELLHNIDPIYNNLPGLKPYPNDHFDTTTGHAAIRVGKWKLLTGWPGIGTWFPRPPHNQNETLSDESSLTKSVRLYNIDEDREERNDLSDKYPEILDKLLSKLAEYNSQAVTPQWTGFDWKSDPVFHEGYWVPWV